VSGVAARPRASRRRRAGGRSLRGGLALAALTALLLLPAGATAATETGDCAWHHHVKRVVRHVKRHGKRVRVLRQRPYWSCDPVPAVAAPPAAPPVTPPVLIDPGGIEPESDPHRLGVSAHDFYFVLSKRELSSGEETIELSNQGQDAHNLHVEGAGGTELELPETQKEGHASAEVDLAPGTYRLFCSLPEHAEKGMETTLVVAP
jgi:plastocyanin